MKWIRFADPSGRILHGIPQPTGHTARVLSGDLRHGFVATEEEQPVARLLAPVEPTVIYATGLNYRDHAAETGAPVPEYPVLFFKSPRSVLDPGGEIRFPSRLPVAQLDYEAELAVVLARDCRNATREDASSFIAGYTCANDLSARDWQLQRSSRQWCRAKSFDTFCPLGPCVVDIDELGPAPDLRIRSRLNGKVVQDSRTSEFIFGIGELLEFLSADTTLPAGAVILTGTPGGVGMARTPPLWLQPGDEITVEIEGIGSLTNRVTGRPG